MSQVLLGVSEAGFRCLQAAELGPDVGVVLSELADALHAGAPLLALPLDAPLQIKRGLPLASDVFMPRDATNIEVEVVRARRRHCAVAKKGGY